MKNEKIIAVIGLGYVGLPLAIEFGKNRKVIGYDINENRIIELNNGIDRTKECSNKEIESSIYLKLTYNTEEIKEARIYIVTVPTPVDKANKPDLNLLHKANQLIGKNLKLGDIVIYESTVYPGATEEVCVPDLEKSSGLVYNKEFYCGYSPERINPGDKKNKLVNITKITSGSLPDIAEEIDILYKEIIKAGTYKASSIKVAEAAKVIENTQRDLNIALMNELSILFKKIDIDTAEVIKAASTKWNFIPFKPGLVGGHCIGVDPYYLTYKAQEVGYQPEVILAGRRINDNMASYVAEETIKLMVKKSFQILGSKVLVLGLTFKEECTDIRNTKVIDIINKFKDFGMKVDIYDPWINLEEANKEYKLRCLQKFPKKQKYSAIIIAVAHNYFINIGLKEIKKLGVQGSVIYDVKGIFPASETDSRL